MAAGFVHSACLVAQILTRRLRLFGASVVFDLFLFGRLHYSWFHPVWYFTPGSDMGVELARIIRFPYKCTMDVPIERYCTKRCG
jgi:hypothetical protein